MFVALGVIGFAGAVWMVLALLLVLGRRAPRRLVLETAAAVWVADLVAIGIKPLVDRPRPFESIPGVEGLMGAVGSSFPSGHAATAAAGAIVIATAVPRLMPVAALLAVAIAFSRLYVGAHYPTDVIAGAAIGAVSGLLVVALRSPRWRGRAPWRSRRLPPPG